MRNIEQTAEKLKLMGNPTRLRILEALARGECSVSTICRRLKLPQAKVSQHLALLRSRDIVTATRQGVSVCYSLSDGQTLKLLQTLSSGLDGRRN